MSMLCVIAIVVTILSAAMQSAIPAGETVPVTHDAWYRAVVLDPYSRTLEVDLDELVAVRNPDRITAGPR